jgi:hypothetical protein
MFLLCQSGTTALTSTAIGVSFVTALLIQSTSSTFTAAASAAATPMALIKKKW